VERLKAKERMEDPVQNFAEGETGRTRDKVAEAVGLGSGETYRKAKYIQDHDPDAVERIDRGESSIHREYERLKAELEQKDERIHKLQKALEQELQKPPKVEYLERIPEDFALKLIATEERAKELEAKVDRLTKERNLLEKKAKLNEEEAAKYNQLQGQLKQLALEKEHLYRQIESATELSGLVVEIKHLLDKLAPVRYSRALERLDSEVAIRNITELVEMVESWCREMRQYLPSGNYVNAEVVIHEQ
jgi:ParB family chromosome partitioning protein